MVWGTATKEWSIDKRTFLKRTDDSHNGMETAINEGSANEKISPREISG